MSKTYYCFYLKLVSYYSVFTVSGRVFAQGWCQNLCKNLPLIVFKDSDNFLARIAGRNCVENMMCCCVKECAVSRCNVH